MGRTLWSALFLTSSLVLDAAEPSFRVPQGTLLEIRTRNPLSTVSTPRGAAVEAVLIGPVKDQDRLLILPGAVLKGRVEEIRGVGFGLLRERARLKLVFDSLEIGSAKVPLRASVSRLENAREEIDAQARINGIRSTGTLAYKAAGTLSGMASFDPLIFLFTRAASMSALRFPEPEILLPEGTELTLRLDAPVDVPEPAASPLNALDAESRRELHVMLEMLPFRTATSGAGKPSDFVNLLFAGSQEALERAFAAARWTRTDALNAQSAYRTIRAIAESQEYRAAPMSTLLLGGQHPNYEFAKTLNSFARRHHLRVWRQPVDWNGTPVWLSSSTHDIGIAASKKNRTFIHVIDENIDHERAKVVNDLMFTGCVEGVELMHRPWLPDGAQNGTGQTLKTDKAIAVIRLNACLAPIGAPAGGQPARPIFVKRATRLLALSVRNDVLRDNIGVTAFNAVRTLRRGQQPLVPGPDRPILASEAASDDFAGAEHPSAIRWSSELDAAPPHPEAKAYVPPVLEFSLSAGVPRLGGGIQSTQVINVGNGSAVFGVGLNNTFGGRWALSPRVGVNGGERFTHEMGYSYGSANMWMFVDEVTDGAEQAYRMDVRRFSYNLLIHATRRKLRIRPYVAVGPALQLVRLADSDILKPSRYFRLGLKDLGIFSAAWQFGSEPPMEGGGIFQPALELGGGVKFHKSNRLFFRVDYRAALAKQLDFWTKSHEAMSGGFSALEADEFGLWMMPGELRRFGSFRQHTLSFGVGMAF